MLRIAAFLIVLWLFASGAWAAIGAQSEWPAASAVVLGLGLGQVQLLAFALVLVRRWFWFRLAALALAIGYWSAAAPLPPAITTPGRAIIFLTAALLAAAWCGWSFLLGLRLVEEKSDSSAVRATGADDGRRQFSLATVLLVMGIVGVYLALVRSARVDTATLALVLAAVFTICLPGCLLLTIFGASRAARMGCAAVIACYGIVPLNLWEMGIIDREDLYDGGCLLAAQLVLIAVALSVLNIAGIRLERLRSTRTAISKDFVSQPSPLASTGGS
jgi:hypothetical protein